MKMGSLTRYFKNQIGITAQKASLSYQIEIGLNRRRGF